MKKFTSGAIAAGALIAAGLYANSAQAQVLVTLDPSGAVPALSADGPFQTNNATIANNAVITIDGAGNFTETGFFKITSWNVGGATVPGTGIQTNYNIYGTFSVTGTASILGPIVLGSISSFSYTLFGDPGGDTTFPVSGIVGINDAELDDFTLGTGSSSSGIVSLLPGPVGTLSTIATFTPAAGTEGTFFVAPIPFDIKLDTSAISVISGTTSTCGAGFPCTITIDGGGGSIQFIPEPASLALFGAGLAALGFGVRRRRQVA